MKNVKINEYIKFGIAIVLLYVFYGRVGIGCPIKFLTGVSCAGCGMTRAWTCLVHLDIKGAFYYHPLFFLPIIYFFLFLIKDKISHKTFNCVLVVGMVLFITIYIFRILNPDDIVININIENGFIYKFLQNGGF
ncbi:DUF2752 domain-containing protein [Clostridium botulinum]|uniref:DUF2752 domain-containing protein n=2 Tax=Clostridium botulinum TaxID=1491 RepID=B2TJP2_CLOBB|nr:conserved hypothetical protein [Clostridium botulinum B str. Eklund 17B (NRP)]MBY6974757.1 DUF2752 domain-containing protein [Clostridium botulinum]MBY6999743.1 DUF2752 domain-containing protein [Clostridium botulinum]MCR1275025.1 DUF2752 domain-containing protein [Clostridium botulinum]NFD70725.1 DUF2752 domain-containing protein [Clostridium botulinum]